MKKDELLGYGLLIVICVIGFIALILRVEQIDIKKELPVTTQSNSANF